MRHREIPLQPAVAAVTEFRVHDRVEEGLVGQTLGLGALQKRVELRGCAAQSEGVEAARRFSGDTHSTPPLSAQSSPNLRWYASSERVATTGTTTDPERPAGGGGTGAAFVSRRPPRVV